MTTPAPFGRFVLATCYGVGVVQVGMLGLMVLLKVSDMFLGIRHRGSNFPDWLGLLDVVLSAVAVCIMWVMWRRGDLDETIVRRRPPR